MNAGCAFSLDRESGFHHATFQVGPYRMDMGFLRVFGLLRLDQISMVLRRGAVSLPFEIGVPHFDNECDSIAGVCKGTDGGSPFERANSSNWPPENSESRSNSMFAAVVQPGSQHPGRRATKWARSLITIASKLPKCSTFPFGRFANLRCRESVVAFPRRIPEKDAI